MRKCPTRSKITSWLLAIASWALACSTGMMWSPPTISVGTHAARYSRSWA